jgi:four helix bundle protein
MNKVVKEKSFAFAVLVVHLYIYLCKEKKEFVPSKQLLQSGTAIGALVRESEQAKSKADFIHKLSIALKEANETDYGRLKLLTSIIKSTKRGETQE